MQHSKRPPLQSLSNSSSSSKALLQQQHHHHGAASPAGAPSSVGDKVSPFSNDFFT